MVNQLANECGEDAELRDHLAFIDGLLKVRLRVERSRGATRLSGCTTSRYTARATYILRLHSARSRFTWLSPRKCGLRCRDRPRDSRTRHAISPERLEDKQPSPAIKPLRVSDPTSPRHIRGMAAAPVISSVPPNRNPCPTPSQKLSRHEKRVKLRSAAWLEAQKLQ